MHVLSKIKSTPLKALKSQGQFIIFPTQVAIQTQSAHDQTDPNIRLLDNYFPLYPKDIPKISQRYRKDIPKDIPKIELSSLVYSRSDPNSCRYQTEHALGSVVQNRTEPNRGLSIFS